jgi:DNA-directed RNA polymerase sigma subunit (sigma70/sigma32)
VGERDTTSAVSVSDEDKERLAAIFGVPAGEVDAKLAALGDAALEEYVLAFTGRRAPSTIREQRELRLQLLYKHLPPGEPTDRQIARLFQMTRSQVGNLIAGARARFETELGARTRDEAIDAVTNATRVDENTIRIVVSDSLARYLKELVDDTSAPPMEKRRDASRTYDLGRSTVSALADRLGIGIERVTALDRKG